MGTIGSAGTYYGNRIRTVKREGTGIIMGRLFGTDGVRGVANEELTPQLAMQLGQAGAYVLTKENAHKPTIMVGSDTRIS